MHFEQVLMRGRVVMLWLLALGMFRALAADPTRFEKEIASIEAAQVVLPDGASPIVFAGSSSFRMWKSLADDLKGFPVINRGFGGSHMSDLNHYAARLVLPLKPAQIFVYEGDNDLNDGKSPEVVLADCQAFVAMVRTELPGVRVTFLAVKPSPSRAKLLDTQRKVNQLLRDWTATDRRLAFLDVFTPMMGADGQPRPELFGPDKLHMNAEGYALWTRLVRARLAQPKTEN